MIKACDFEDDGKIPCIDNRRLMAFYACAALSTTGMGENLDKYFKLLDSDTTFNKTVQSIMLDDLTDRIKSLSKVRKQIEDILKTNESMKH